MRTKTLEFTVYGLKSNEVERKSIFFFVTTETNTGPMGQFYFFLTIELVSKYCRFSHLVKVNVDVSTTLDSDDRCRIIKSSPRKHFRSAFALKGSGTGAYKKRSGVYILISSVLLQNRWYYFVIFFKAYLPKASS